MSVVIHHLWLWLMIQGLSIGHLLSFVYHMRHFYITVSECSRDKLKRKSASHKSTDAVDSGAQCVDAVSTVVTPSPSEQDSMKTEETCGTTTDVEVCTHYICAVPLKPFFYCITSLR